MPRSPFYFLIIIFLLVNSAQARELSVYTEKKPTPSLRLEDLQGNIRDLRDFRGKVVLVNFWASWCPPCRIELPSMWRLKNKLRQEPFEIIAVNMAEPKRDIIAFLPKRLQQSFVVLLDKDGATLNRWRVYALPTSYIIDPQGRIRYVLYGEAKWDAASKIRKIRALLPQKP